MSATAIDVMTLDEFRALPEDVDVVRELLEGRLVESRMTRRNRWHAEVEAAIAGHLRNWVARWRSISGRA